MLFELVRGKTDPRVTDDLFERVVHSGRVLDQLDAQLCRSSREEVGVEPYLGGDLVSGFVVGYFDDTGE